MDTRHPEIQPLEREQRLYERVVEKIITLIQGGAWAPGDRLPPERDLAEAFGVSRTVVREAVKTLEARGVLEALTGSGVYVRSPDSATVSRSLRMYLQLLDQDDIDLRLAEIRRVLEVEIAALAAVRATAEERQELRRLCLEMRKHTGAPRVLAEMDYQLHQLLAEATRNELFGVLLTPLIEQLREHFVYAWEHYGGRPVENVFAQHESVVAAVEAGDAELARSAMAAHIAFYIDILQARVRERQAAAHLVAGNGAAPAAGR
ncbi:MAG TPA: FadR/GntR family transcriptional regulator [Anaerolineae bacterium]|nr:FadR/GntR family transcriptional regulator [Anaerolineae bacterium]